MQKNGAAIVFSAGDLVGHLNCRYLTHLDLKVVKGRLAKPNLRDDPSLDALLERGKIHEKGFVDHLAKQGGTVTVIAGVGIDYASVAQTQQAMARGDAIIVQAALQDGNWSGRADVLRRVETPSSLSAWSYEVIDTKLARETKGNTVLQLSLYSDLLATLQQKVPETAQVVTPGTDYLPETYRVYPSSAHCAHVSAASCMLPGAGLRFYDWRQDFADSWQRFKALVPVVEDPDCTRALTLRMSRSMFPYLAGQRPVRMRRVELWFEAQACHDVRNHEIEFVPDRECECDEENEQCCERYFLTCVASEDWPCLFHGVIEYPFPFLRDDCPITIGDFLFPESVGVVHRAYLVCSYEAGAPERCLPRQPVCDSDCAVLC